jgi:hypothetical protein
VQHQPAGDLESLFRIIDAFSPPLLSVNVPL